MSSFLFVSGIIAADTAKRRITALKSKVVTPNYFLDRKRMNHQGLLIEMNHEHLELLVTREFNWGGVADDAGLVVRMG
jgi:hypothetical protein